MTKKSTSAPSFWRTTTPWSWGGSGLLCILGVAILVHALDRDGAERPREQAMRPLSVRVEASWHSYAGHGLQPVDEVEIARRDTESGRRDERWVDEAFEEDRYEPYTSRFDLEDDFESERFPPRGERDDVPPPAPPRPEPATYEVHVVVEGDRLWDLARRYLGQGALWNKIKEWNPQIDPDRLKLGEKLKIYRDDTSGDPRG